MKAFCTNCGATLNPNTSFCTTCGAPVEAPGQPARRSRKWLWILALLVFFALGFWLGHRIAPKCPVCPAAPALGKGGGGGDGGGGGHPGAGGGDGKGDPDKGGGAGGGGTGRVMGEGGKADGSGGGGSAGSGQGTGNMTGDGQGGGNGTVVGHGYDGSAVGATGSDDGGGGTNGSSKLGDSPNPSEPDSDARKTKLAVARLATGAQLTDSSGDATPMAQGKLASVKVLSANDFTYDKTGLPRYLDANRAVFSAMSYDLPDRTDSYGSGSGIVTGSAFEDVVAWYRKSLPPGWSNSTIGDLSRLGAVAQAMSPDKIMQMLSAPRDATPAKSVGDLPATATADRTRLSMFSPPAGTKGDLGVMIVQRGDQPVTIMMKSHTSP